MTALSLLLVGGGVLMIYSGITGQPLVQQLRLMLSGGSVPSSSAPRGARQADRDAPRGGRWADR